MIIAGGGTGGHLYPALNLAAALKRLMKEDLEVLLLGAERGIEARVLPEKGVAHQLLPFEPIYRRRPWRNWRTLLAGVKSSRTIMRLFDSFDPDLVVGTGGYASGPVLAWAVYRRLTTAIQEQNSYPGITTRLLAPFVDQVHLGSPKALRYLETVPSSRVRMHGNPIRMPTTRPDVRAAREEFRVGDDRVVLIVGGSQGAKAINESLLAALSAVEAGDLAPLPADVCVLWSTGDAHYEGVQSRLRDLGAARCVRALPYIDEMDRALAVTTLAVSRAGALALAELCAWSIPSILVPYPFGAGDHQRMNARTHETAGASIVLEESEMQRDPTLVWRLISDLLADAARLEAMRSAASELGAPDAAERIAKDLAQLMEAA